MSRLKRLAPEDVLVTLQTGRIEDVPSGMLPTNTLWVSKPISRKRIAKELATYAMARGWKVEPTQLKVKVIQIDEFHWVGVLYEGRRSSRKTRKNDNE